MANKSIQFTVEHPDDTGSTQRADLLENALQESSMQQTSGNLLIDMPDCTLVEIEGYNIEELTDDQVVHLAREEGLGTLTVYTQTTQDHSTGDFVYTTHSADAQAQESFGYQVHTPDGDIQLTAVFHATPDGPTLGQADLGFVDEEGLIPGQHEALETFGNLDIDFADSQAAVQFAPLTQQHELIRADLSHQGTPLYYQLNDTGTKITATQGAHGSQVFDVELFEDGSYAFKLHANLDREQPENLLSDPSFETVDKGPLFMFNQPVGWQKHEASVTQILDSQSEQDETILTQSVLTRPGEVYQLSFYFGSNEPNESSVELYWNDKLVHTFDGAQPWQGYSFGLEGGKDNYSEIKLVASQLSNPIQESFHQLTLTSSNLKKLPIEFEYELVENNEVLDSSLFQVQVSSEPPIILDNSQPYNIMYEQAMYQSIVVQASHDNDNPLTKLSLDTLFNNLNISQENRQVDVVQLEEDGQLSNIYEVKISDKTGDAHPITVADVHLSFNGGDGGLEVFQRHILILDT